MFEHTIFPLGDVAITIDFGNVINEDINKTIIALFEKISSSPFDGMIEAIPAYSSLTVFYNFRQINAKISSQDSVQDWVKEKLEKFLMEIPEKTSTHKSLHRIPVCYDIEYGSDITTISKQKNISVSDVIQIHSSKKYRVYMLGFLPGFAYMGEVDDQIAAPRKLQPTPIKAGSVGIAGKQTGIYPLNSPGGWQIVGRTPLKIFDPTRIDPCLLKAGDEVEFFSITKNEFENYQSRNS